LVQPDASHPQGTGLFGAGPNSGSTIYESLKQSSTGRTTLDNIFHQNTSTSNFITWMFDRTNDPLEQHMTSTFTIGEVISGQDSITSQPQLSVPSANLPQNNHWVVSVDQNGIIGPDGNPVNATTVVQGTKNKNQLTAMMDTGYTFPQVPK